MEKQPTYIETYGALTPPESNPGVGWLTRLIVNLFLGGKDCWAARAGNPQEAPLIDMVAKLCPKMGIQTPPELIIYTSQQPNAASITGGKVVVSEKLLSIMTPEEVESVMGHELAHHRHGLRDTVAIYGGVIAGDYAYQKTLSPKLTRLIDGVKNARAKMALYIAKPVMEFLGFVGLINLYQQKIEYESDRESGLVTGHPEVMADALNALGDYGNKMHQQERLERRARMSDAEKVVTDTVEKIEPKWVRRILRNPFEVLGSHPPIKLRVEALKAQEAQMHPDKATLPDASVIR